MKDNKSRTRILLSVTINSRYSKKYLRIIEVIQRISKYSTGTVLIVIEDN
jgi:hypothetical protein